MDIYWGEPVLMFVPFVHRVFPEAENWLSPDEENGGNCANNDGAQFTRILRLIVLERGIILPKPYY